MRWLVVLLMLGGIASADPERLAHVNVPTTVTTDTGSFVAMPADTLRVVSIEGRFAFVESARGSGFIAATALVFVAPPPVVQPPIRVAPAEVAPQHVATHWYGWQIALADLGVLGLGAATGGAATFGWLASGAIVHFAHGQTGKGLGSIGLRAGLPLAGILIGAGASSGCSGDFCQLGGAVVGGLAGVVTAEIIDLAIARDEVVESTSQARLVPTVHASRTGVALGVVTSW